MVNKMWYLLILILFIPLNIKIINVFDTNQVRFHFLGFEIGVDKEAIKTRLMKNKITLRKIINYLSLSNLVTDLFKITYIKEFVLIKYYQANRFEQTYPVVTYYFICSIIEGFLASNHKKYNFEKRLIKDEIRNDYDFNIWLKISIIQILFCLFKNLGDVISFFKKERLTNGS